MLRVIVAAVGYAHLVNLEQSENHINNLKIHIRQQLVWKEITD
jgi:hypothetical protein